MNGQSNLASHFPENSPMTNSTARRRALFDRLFALCLCFGGLAVAARAAVPAPQIKYEKYTLKNGLEVILAEDHRLPLVAVDLWYHVGPANERAGRTGFAHLFEHMMFEGSQHVGSKEHDRYLEAAGASDINGTTDFDRTNYFETLPSNQLELALWLESDRMGYLLGKIDQERLANQHDVVRNERRQSVENSAYGLVEEELYHQLFPKSYPYFADVIGSHRDIEAARLDDVREFFRQYYTPNNASLTITGDIDPAQAKAWVEKYFGEAFQDHRPGGTAAGLHGLDHAFDFPTRGRGKRSARGNSWRRQIQPLVQVARLPKTDCAGRHGHEPELAVGVGF